MTTSSTIALRPATRADARSWSSLTRDELQDWATSTGLPRFRAAQVYTALYKQFAQSFDDITVLPAALRERMAKARPLRSLATKVHGVSREDASEKMLFQLADGATVETVLIPGKSQGGRGRYTVCVSSQVGCPAACTFCATGLGGFTRNLTGEEIVDQVAYFAYALQRSREHVTNIVFMGMGEPFLNVRGVQRAVQNLVSADGMGIGQRSITISTVGIVPQILKFPEWAGQVNLAISLHAPNDSLRTSLVPYNTRWQIAELLDSVEQYIQSTHRRVSFEYVLLRGVNDSLPIADELADLLGRFGHMAHVNVIPWNPFREGKFMRSEGPDAVAFADRLYVRGINATIRYSRGLDISAACGQLRERDQGDGSDQT